MVALLNGTPSASCMQVRGRIAVTQLSGNLRQGFALHFQKQLQFAANLVEQLPEGRALLLKASAQGSRRLVQCLRQIDQRWRFASGQ